MKFFGAGSGDQIDHGSGTSAIFRLVVGHLHVDFDQRIRGRGAIKLTLAGGVCGVHAINTGDGGTGACSVDAGVDRGVAARSGGIRSAGNAGKTSQQAAIIQSAGEQSADLMPVESSGTFRAFSLYRGGSACTVTESLILPTARETVPTDLLSPAVTVISFFVRRETAHLHGNGVGSGRRHGGKSEVSAGIGFPWSGSDSGILIGQG